MSCSEKMIHPTAVIDAGARIEDNVHIGPYTVIGPGVTIGKGSYLGPHVYICKDVELGENTKIYSGASIGTDSQDLKYQGEKSLVRIGRNTVVRECVTINRGTSEGTETCVGKNCLLMAYCHVAHNCEVGDYVIMANAATLAGHVVIEDRAVLGGLSAVHQFCRVGTFSIIGGCSKVVQDVPPFSMVDGHPVKVKSINAIGMKRKGIPMEIRKDIKKAFKILFHSKHAISNAIEIVRKEIPSSAEIEHLLNFILGSQRGISR